MGSGFVGSAIAGVVVDKTKLFTPITKFCFTIGVASIVGFSIVSYCLINLLSNCFIMIVKIKIF